MISKKNNKKQDFFEPWGGGAKGRLTVSVQYEKRVNRGFAYGGGFDLIAEASEGKGLEFDIAAKFGVSAILDPTAPSDATSKKVKVSANIGIHGNNPERPADQFTLSIGFGTAGTNGPFLEITNPKNKLRFGLYEVVVKFALPHLGCLFGGGDDTAYFWEHIALSGVGVTFVSYTVDRTKVKEAVQDIYGNLDDINLTFAPDVREANVLDAVATECALMSSAACVTSSLCDFVENTNECVVVPPKPCADRMTECVKAGDSCVLNSGVCEEKKDCTSLSPAVCDTTSYCDPVGDNCFEEGTAPVACKDRTKEDCVRAGDNCIVVGESCDEKQACKDLNPVACEAASYCDAVGDNCYEKGEAPIIPCDKRSVEDCMKTGVEFGNEQCEVQSDNTCSLPFQHSGCHGREQTPCEEDDLCHWTGTECVHKESCNVQIVKSTCQEYPWCRWVASSNSCRDRKQSWGDYFKEKGARINVGFVALLTDSELYQTQSCGRTPTPPTPPAPTDNSTATPTSAPPTSSPPTPAPPTPAPTESPPTPEPSTETPSTRRSAKTLSESDTPNLDLAVLFAEAMKSGEAKAPFCFGKCTSPLSASTSVSGDATVETDPGCNEVKLQASTDVVTLSGLGYAVSGTEGGDSFSRVLKAINVDGLGVSDATVTLEAGLDGRVMFELYGTPKFDDTALSFLASTAAGLPVRVSVEHQASYWKLRFEIETKPDTSSNRLRLVDPAGEKGLSLYMQYTTFQSGVPIPGGSFGTGVPVAEFKVSLPVSLCVEGCDAPVGATERVDLYFTGEVGFTFNPTPQVSGDLTASGWWHSALGLPFLHVGEMLLGLDVDIATLLPTRLAVGGAMCLGKKYNCVNSTSPYIKARTYLGLSAKQKEENFFIGMVTRLTIQDLLDVFEEYVPGLEKVRDVLGEATLRTGIYPWDESKCPANDDATPSTNTSTLNLDCYAYVSFSLIDRTIELSPETTVEIASGLQVRGVLDLFGWQIRSYVRIDERAVVINTSMSDALAVSIGDFDLMKIGHHFDDASGELVGGANFFLKLVPVPLEAAVDINGAFEIALLGAKGSVAVRLDKDVFRFNMEMGLFGGAWKSQVQAEWDWAFTHFLIRMESRSWFFVSLDDLSFQYSKAAQKGEFNLDLTVLAIAKLRTNIAIAIVDDAFNLDFFARASLLGAYIEVGGHGVVPADISDMEWELDVEVGFDPLALLKDLSAAVEAVGEFVTEVWNKIADGVSKAWNAVKDAVGGFIKDVAENVKNFFNSVFNNQFMKNLWENGVKLVAGKVVDFFKGVGDFLKDTFTTSRVKDVRYTQLAETNEAECHKIRKSWKVKTCGKAFGWICDTKSHHSDYFDRECMKQRARALVHANEQQEVAGKKEVALDSSRDANPGFAAIHSGAAVPQPTSLSTFKHVVKREGDAQATATFAAGVRRLADPGTADTSPSVFEDAETMVSAGGAVDVSTPEAFEASIAAMQTSLVKKMSDATVSTQGGMSHEAQAVAGVFHYEAPELNAAKSVTIGCANENADYRSHVPTFKNIDSRCTNGSKVILISESEPMLAPPGGGSYQCGTEYVVLVWQGFDDSVVCGGESGTVEQLVTILPPSINFISTPDDVSLTKKDDTKPLYTGFPEWSVGCDVSATLTYSDGDVDSNDDFCGQYTFERTWKVAMDFTDTPYENLTCTAPQARYHVQRITMGVHNSQLLISTAFQSDTHLIVVCGENNPESRNLTLEGKCDFEDAFVASPTVCEAVSQGASWIQVQCKSEGVCTVHRPAKIGFGLNTSCDLFPDLMTKLAETYAGTGSLDGYYDETSALWNTATTAVPTLALTLQEVSATGQSSTASCAGYYRGYADFYHGGEYVRVSGSIDNEGSSFTVFVNVATAPVLTPVELNDVVPHLAPSIGTYAVDKYQAYAEAFAVNCAGCSNADVFAAVKAHYTAQEGGVWIGRSVDFDEVVETLQTDASGAGGSRGWHKYDIMVLEAYEREGSLSFYALDHGVEALEGAASTTFFIYNDVTRKLLTVKKLLANTHLSFGLETNCPILAFVVEPMVAVYEKFLYLNITYGIEGEEGCGQECVGLTTANPTIRTAITHLANSEVEGAGPCEGMYYGFVDFFSYDEGAFRRITSVVEYKGQQVIFELGVEEPPVLTSIIVTANLPRKANELFGEDEGQFAEGFAVNCPGANGTESCDHDVLLEHVTTLYVGRQVTTMTRRGTSALFSDVKEELMKDTTAAGGLPAWTDDQLVVLDLHHSANEANLEIDIFDAVDMNGHAAVFATLYDSDTRRLLVLMQRQEGTQQIIFGVPCPCDLIVNHVAKSLVKLYETNGALEASYTNGDCGHLCQLFLYGHETPVNPTLRWILTRYDPAELSSNPCEGEFDITIDFFSFAEGEEYKRIKTTFKHFGPTTNQIDLVMTSPALLTPFNSHLGLDPSAEVFLVDCASPVTNSGACSTDEFIVQLSDTFVSNFSAANSDEVVGLVGAIWSESFTSVLHAYLTEKSSDLIHGVLTSVESSSVVIYNTATGVLVKAGSQEISFGVPCPCDLIVNHVAKSLVKLYETNGALEASYTNGDCGHLCQLFLYGHETPVNPTLRWILTRYDPAELSSNPCNGEFDITIDFFSFAEGEEYKRIETTFKYFGPTTNQIDLVMTSPALLTPFNSHLGLDPSAEVFLVDCASPVTNSGACSTDEFIVQLSDTFVSNFSAANSDEVVGLVGAMWSESFTSELQAYLTEKSSDLIHGVLTSVESSSVVIYNTATGVLVKANVVVAA